MILEKIRAVFTGSVIYLSAFFLYTDLLFDQTKQHTVFLIGSNGAVFAIAFFISLLCWFILHRATIQYNRYTIFKCAILIFGIWLFLNAHIRSSLFVFIGIVFVFFLFSSERICNYLIFLWGCMLIVRSIYFSEIFSFDGVTDFISSSIVAVFGPLMKLSRNGDFLLFPPHVYQTKIFADEVKLLIIPFLSVMLCFSLYFLFSAQFKRMLQFQLSSIPVYFLSVAGSLFFLKRQDYSHPIASLYLQRPFIFLALLIPLFLYWLDFKDFRVVCPDPFRRERFKRLWVTIFLVFVMAVIAAKNYHWIGNHTDLNFIVSEIHSDWEPSYVEFAAGVEEPTR